MRSLPKLCSEGHRESWSLNAWQYYSLFGIIVFKLKNCSTHKNYMPKDLRVCVHKNWTTLSYISKVWGVKYKHDIAPIQEIFRKLPETFVSIHLKTRYGFTTFPHIFIPNNGRSTGFPRSPYSNTIPGQNTETGRTGSFIHPNLHNGHAYLTSFDAAWHLHLEQHYEISLSR
jgi:hypothetical protein